MPTISVSCTGTAQDLDDFCAAFSYRATLEDGSANPETKAQFFQRKMKQHAAEVVKSHRVNKRAEDERRAAASDNANFSF